jgi:predicted nucleic acid-binding protein
VSRVYLDTSVLGRALFAEPEQPAIEEALEAATGRTSSRLLRIELRRLGIRHDLLGGVDRLLAGVSLIPIDEEILIAAETLQTTTVATLDAIHLATAIGLRDEGVLDTLMTYDKQLAAGARQHGIEVLSPA